MVVRSTPGKKHYQFFSWAVHSRDLVSKFDSLHVFGPNATTFVVPAEIFPARFRSTCHGISAASGKLGAIIGAFGFLYLAQNQDKAKADAGYPAGIGVRNSLLVLGVVNLLGLLFTFLVPESKGKSLEEMSGENEVEEEQ